MSADASPGPGYQRILVATDFSDASRLAMEWALEFARVSGARIDLIHVLTLHGGDPARVEEEMPRAVPEEAEGHVDSRRVERAISAEIGIVHAARDLHADLVVLGTHGRTGLSHVFLGSVAERVVQLAPCPVLTVREPGQEFEHP